MRILLTLSLLLAAWCAPGQPFFKCKDGHVEFNSNAPLEVITASSEELTGIIDVSNKTFGFIVRMRSFEGFNASLQREHFNENYMESTRYPRGSFKGKIIEDVDFSVPGERTIRAKGVLSLHGVERERIIKAVMKVQPDGIRLESWFTILLADHDIRIPKVVNEKIAEEIDVIVRASLLPE